MGVTPGFVCLYFGAQSWGRTDKGSFLLGDQRIVPFPPPETPEVPPVRTGTAACVEGGP